MTKGAPMAKGKGPVSKAAPTKEAFGGLGGMFTKAKKVVESKSNEYDQLGKQTEVQQEADPQNFSDDESYIEYGDEVVKEKTASKTKEKAPVRKVPQNAEVTAKKTKED